MASPRVPGKAGVAPGKAVTTSIAVILAALFALSLAAWLLMARQSQGGSMIPSLLPGAEPMRGSSVSMLPVMAAPIFIGMWVVMMVAMMFPSVAPMVVAHHRLSAQREETSATWLFVLAYLLVWAAVGVLAYGGYRLILQATPALSATQARMLGGGILVVTGLYQLTRFKAICLRHCRGPLHFALNFEPGRSGAMRMGVSHGFFCLGCCWGLMVVLFVVGLMNLLWMGVISAIIFVEKVAPAGERLGKGVGLGLAVLGAALITWPAIVAAL